MNINKLKILRSPDDAPASGVDPLSGAASGWEPPKFPLLAPDRRLKFEIIKSEKTTNEKGFTQLAITHKLLEDSVDTDGKPIRQGFRVFKRISLTETPESATSRGWSFKNIGAELSQLLKAVVLADRSPAELRDNPTLIEGRIVVAVVGIQKGKDPYPDQNTLKYEIPG